MVVDLVAVQGVGPVSLDELEERNRDVVLDGPCRRVLRIQESQDGLFGPGCVPTVGWNPAARVVVVEAVSVRLVVHMRQDLVASVCFAAHLDGVIGVSIGGLEMPPCPHQIADHLWIHRSVVAIQPQE